MSSKIKVVCDACGARYQVRNPKVKGRRFRATCKRCGGVIVAQCPDDDAERYASDSWERGAADAADGYAAGGWAGSAGDAHGLDAPGAYGDEACWYAVIEGEPYGPLTSVELRQAFAAGQVGPRTYLWCSGDSDWRRLHDVPDFGDLLTDEATQFYRTGAEEQEAASDDGIAPRATRPLGPSTGEEAGPGEHAAAGGAAPAPLFPDEPDHRQSPVAADDEEEKTAYFRHDDGLVDGGAASAGGHQVADEEATRWHRRQADPRRAPAPVELTPAVAATDGSGPWPPVPMIPPRPAALPRPTGQPRHSLAATMGGTAIPAAGGPEPVAGELRSPAASAGRESGPGRAPAGHAAVVPALAPRSAPAAEGGPAPAAEPVPAPAAEPVPAPASEPVPAPASEPVPPVRSVFEDSLKPVGPPVAGPLLLTPQKEAFWTTGKIAAAAASGGGLLVALTIVLVVTLSGGERGHRDAVPGEQAAAATQGARGEVAAEPAAGGGSGAAPGPAAEAAAEPSPESAGAADEAADETDEAPASSASAKEAAAKAEAEREARAEAAEKAAAEKKARARAKAEDEARATPKARRKVRSRPRRAARKRSHRRSARRKRPAARRRRKRGSAPPDVDALLAAASRSSKRKREPKPAAPDPDSILAAAAGQKKKPARKPDPDAILAAGSQGPAGRASRPAPSPGLPKRPSQSQIRGAMRRILPGIRACHDKYKKDGRVEVQVTLKGDGSANARLKGTFVGTPTGFCVLGQVHRARFPKFSGRPFTFTYPFELK